MNIGISLEQMTVAEKIEMMEKIWEDLSKDVKSPQWHGKILNERKIESNKGYSDFIDWETSKKRIRDIVS